MAETREPDAQQLAQMRVAVASALPRIIFERCERAIELPSPHAQFREDIANAVFLCLLIASVEPLKRYSHLRAELRSVARKAQALARAIEELRGELDQMTASIHDALEHYTGCDLAALCAHAAEYHQLAQLADAACLVLRDRSGRSMMMAFNALICGLADAYERATRNRPTVIYDGEKHPDEQYRGPFLDLVEAILPCVTAFTKAVGKPIRQPTSKSARGSYVQSVCRARQDPARPPSGRY